MLKPLARISLPLACVFLLITSCSLNKRSKKEIAFIEVFHGQGMNEKLKLTVDYLSGSMAQGYDFFVYVENISKDSIWFTNDLGIRIYQYDEDKAAWINVRNKVIYSGDSGVLEPKGMETPPIMGQIASPDLPKGNEGKIVRVVVLGKIYRDGSPTDEPVGGWIDVTLPQYK
jgi:hypothetical protein